MWLHEPGSFTRIIAAMVMPRKTSSETIRPAGALATAVNVLEARGMIVCAVAMKDPSVGADNIAARKTPQCPALKNPRGNTKLFAGHSFRRDLRPAIHAASEFAAVGQKKA